MSVTLPDDPNEVTILVGETQFRGWQQVSISLSCESMPNSFTLSASTEFLQGAALRGTKPNQGCKIYICKDLVITGWIDRRSITIDAHSHQVSLRGRGMTRNLCDCSADLMSDPDLSGGQVSGANTLDLAQKLSKAYGVRVRSAVSDLGPAIPVFQVQLGETPYQVIESIAHYARYLVYEDADGALVLDRVGTQQMASGFIMPGNIEAISADRSVDTRYSDYLVVWSAINQLREKSATANERTAHVIDETMTQPRRLKIIVSQQIVPGQDFATALANWEKARRIGRSQAAQITCDNWRDMNGKLWAPNWLAVVDARAADIEGATWIIGTVTFRKDASGTHADLVLMPPDAFTPEPNPLNLFNRELVGPNAANAGPDPATSTLHLTGDQV